MSRKPNKWGCIPSEDVCLAHDEPLECPHGCSEAKEHKCKFKESPGYVPLNPPEQKEDDDGN